jgi:hypothetical protein
MGLFTRIEVWIAGNHEDNKEDDQDHSGNDQHHLDILPPHGVLQFLRGLLELNKQPLLCEVYLAEEK